MSGGLRASIDRANWSIFTSFDYNSADRFLAEAFDELALIPSRDLSDPALSHLLRDAHYLKAIVLRDRSDVRAEPHFMAALSANPPEDRMWRRILLGGLITARLNRRDHEGAGQVLKKLAATTAAKEMDADDISKFSRYCEAIGLYERAAKIMAGYVLPRRVGSPEEEATARTALARQTALSALKLPPRQRARMLRVALDHLERSYSLLADHRHDIWTVSNRASWGLVSVVVGDRETARLLLRDAQQVIRRVAIRNKWVEELSQSLGPDADADSSSSLAVSWGRMYYSRSFSSDRLAFLELERGFEHLLRCTSSWDGTEARPHRITAPGMKLWRQANERLTLTEGFDLRSAVSDREVLEVLQSRNSAAHEVSPPGSIDFDVECRKLAAHVERLEALLPPELLGQALGEFRYRTAPAAVAGRRHQQHRS
jgi:hypothetical protein